MKRIIPFISIFLITACNKQSNSKLIIGTWGPRNPKPDFKVALTFIDKENARFSVEANGITSIDSIIYKFNAAETKILSAEKNGKIDELKIFKLTKTDLILIRNNDTLFLERK